MATLQSEKKFAIFLFFSEFPMHVSPTLVLLSLLPLMMTFHRCKWLGVDQSNRNQWIGEVKRGKEL